MTRDRLITGVMVLAVAAVFYALAVGGLVWVQGLSLRQAVLPNEATVLFSLLGGLACVMLWRAR